MPLQGQFRGRWVACIPGKLWRAVLTLGATGARGSGRTHACRLAEQHGAKTLRKGALNGETVDLEAARGALLERFPVSGRLEVEFRSQRRPPEASVPLSAAHFDAVWTRCGVGPLFRCLRALRANQHLAPQTRPICLMPVLLPPSAECIHMA